MYFNDVFVGYYVAVTFIGFVVGKICAWCNIRIPDKKKIFSKDFFVESKKGIKFNYIYMIITAILYCGLLYKYGINKSFFENLDLIKYMILVPFLLLIFSIDLEHRIIPNRLTLLIFEIGLIITFLYGISNINMAKNYILGMIVGAGIFFIILVLGKLFYQKESMGYGDVKLIGALGLYFGYMGIVEISIASFIIGALVSVVILIVRNLILKNKDEYVAFGPFIVISALLCIFLPTHTILDLFLNFCRWISYKI